MSEHDETYGRERAARLAAMLRELAERIRALETDAALLGAVPELLQRLGDLRTELFHYEVRATYDTPEVAENRRLVDEIRRSEGRLFDQPEDEEPWRKGRGD